MVGAVLEGQLLARLADAPELTASAITFESEAEKPTRALARRKGAEAPLPEEAPLDEPLLEEQTEQEADAELEAETVADGEPSKKRTRRGRAGRQRKKAPTAEQPEVGEEPLAADGEAAAVPVEAAPAPAKRRRPKIHVPPEDESNGDSATAEPAPAVADAEAAANGQPEVPKKKTRRGTSRRAQAQEAGGRLRGNRRDARAGRSLARAGRNGRGLCPDVRVARRLRPTLGAARPLLSSLGRGRLPAFSTSSFPRP